MDKTLQLVFRNIEGSTFSILLGFPKENLTEAEVSAAMDLIIAKNIFDSAGGALTGKVRARLVSRETQDIASFV